MSRKKREHKSRPGAKVSSNGVYFVFKNALNQQKPLNKRELSQLMVAPYIALDALIKHDGGEAQGIDLAAALTLGRIFSGRGIGDEYLASFDLGLAALWRMKKRAKTHGKWRLDGDGIVALRECLGLYEQQLAYVTHKGFESACVEARGMIGSDKNYVDIEHFEAAA